MTDSVPVIRKTERAIQRRGITLTFWRTYFENGQVFVAMGAVPNRAGYFVNAALRTKLVNPKHLALIQAARAVGPPPTPADLDEVARMYAESRRRTAEMTLQLCNVYGPPWHARPTLDPADVQALIDEMAGGAGTPRNEFWIRACPDCGARMIYAPTAEELARGIESSVWTCDQCGFETAPGF